MDIVLEQCMTHSSCLWFSLKGLSISDVGFKKISNEYSFGMHQSWKSNNYKWGNTIIYRNSVYTFIIGEPNVSTSIYNLFILSFILDSMCSL